MVEHTRREGPRRWLARAGGTLPGDANLVRDDQGRVWSRGEDRRFHTLDRRHHLTGCELLARTDLVEAEVQA